MKKYTIMLLALFAATAANVSAFFLTWDPKEGYLERRMVHVTHCVDYLLYPSSPGQFERGPNGVDCSRFTPYWVLEPRKLEGVVAGVLNNPLTWTSLGFLVVFSVTLGWKFGSGPEPRRKPPSKLPPEPEDFGDPAQMGEYMRRLRERFHIEQ